MAEGNGTAVAEPGKDAATKLDSIRDMLASMHSRMDSYEAEAKARKDAETARKDAEAAAKSRFDAARKDRFGARKDGESYKDWKARHDADEAAMCDAMRKDGADMDMAMADAKRARHDAEDAEKRDAGESFERWAKEEEGELNHKKDADAEAEKEKATEEERKDSAAKIAGLQAQLAELSAMVRGVTAETPAADRDALAAAQARHDSVAARFGDRAPPPIPGETPLAYRRRLAARLQRHSLRVKDTSLAALDSGALGAVEDIIYADAIAVSTATVNAMPGRLVERVSREGGRDVTRFDGDPMSWMQHFMTGAQVGRFNRNAKGA